MGAILAFASGVAFRGVCASAAHTGVNAAKSRRLENLPTAERARKRSLLHACLIVIEPSAVAGLTQIRRLYTRPALFDLNQ
jgi:hypothetical protein